MSSINSPEYSRNFGFYSEAEQEAMSNSVVALAGAGGDGFQLGVRLAMNGVKELRVADPEVFEPENSNRVFGAARSNLGKNKAEVLQQTIADIRPDTKVVVYNEGVNGDNVEEFVRGSDLLIDESELTYLHIGTMLSREAIKHSIPELLVMNVGFAGLATSFHPQSKKSFEKIMGIPKGTPIDEVAEMNVDFSRIIPYIPPYGDDRTLQSVLDGSSLPSISHGVDMASSIGTTEAMLHLTSQVKNKRRQPVWAPNFRYMDAYTNKSGIKHHPRLSYALTGAAMKLRSMAGVNPLASYSKEDQARRRESQQ